MVEMTLRNRRRIPVASRPVPASVAWSEVFAKRLLKLEAAADLRHDPPFAKLAAMKDMIHEAACLAQQELRVAYADEKRVPLRPPSQPPRGLHRSEPEPMGV